MSRIALPPGVYRIIKGDWAITSPSTTGGALIYTAKKLNTTEQQWQISANGICTPMTAAGYYAWSSGTGTVSSRKGDKYEWIINATTEPGGAISGWIMTNDTSRLYWGTAKNNVTLAASPTPWTFEPVA